MLEIKFLRQNLDVVQRALIARQSDLDLSVLEAADERRRNVLLELEELRHKRNVVSNRIAELKQSGDDAQDLVDQMREVAAEIKTLESSLAFHEETVNNILMELPNIPHASVPDGKNADDNFILKKVGTPIRFEFEPQAHWDLGSGLGILDFERAAKITGARFPLYLGLGARLERALINLMLDMHISEHGYTEVLPPFAVNRQSMTNTGQLPKFEHDLFKLEGWDYFMIPTAEVPLTNIHQGEVLNAAQLPIYYTAYSPCFRSEAGSYGKDTRGLIRQHQFNKVEMVKLTEPETYREISSCSNCENFQSRRANIRFRQKGKKGTDLVHTLNGSGLAVGRTVAAVLENYQRPDGGIDIPAAVKPYFGGLEAIRP